MPDPSVIAAETAQEHNISQRLGKINGQKFFHQKTFVYDSHIFAESALQKLIQHKGLNPIPVAPVKLAVLRLETYHISVKQRLLSIIQRILHEKIEQQIPGKCLRKGSGNRHHKVLIKIGDFQFQLHVAPVPGKAFFVGAAVFNQNRADR